MKQMTLATGTGFEKHSRPTRKAAFLAEMETLIPWADFCELIEPHYPKVGNGRPPIGLERMLRMYFIANWFNLADVACEDALYDVAIFREFCRIDLGRERVPDADFFFAHPYASWERGANENMNGLIRQFFPKKMRFDTITDKDIAFAMHRLNHRPRKCLAFKTPHEVFMKQLHSRHNAVAL